jgi:DNA polymerase-3 subunit beta
MKFTCSQSDLSHALRAVSRAVGTGRSGHPILAGVLLAADAGSVRVTAYDLDLGISTAITAAVDTTGACVVPHRLLADITGRLDASEALSLAVDGTRVTLTAAGGSYSLSVASAEDFPALPVVDAAAGAAVDLSAPLAAVLPAAATDASKQLLTGVHLVIADGAMRLEATDGHRLAVRTADTDAADLDIVLPARTLQQIRQPATITADNRQAAIALADGTLVVSRLLDGTYPNVQQLIPASYEHTATVSRLAMLAALERVAVIADSHNSVVKLTTKAKRLTIASEAEANSGSESIAMDGTLPTLAFNVHYLIDAFKHLDGDTATISGNSSTTPVVFEPGLTLVMPVQVR